METFGGSFDSEFTGEDNMLPNEQLENSVVNGGDLSNTEISDSEVEVVNGEWVRFEKMAFQKGGNLAYKGSLTGGGSLYTGDISESFIFYSHDNEGNRKDPLIRMDLGHDDKGVSNHIYNIRGTGLSECLDPKIAKSNLLEEKFEELNSKYKLRDSDVVLDRIKNLKKLSLIAEKKGKETQTGESLLSEDDLRFLYEVDGRMNLFRPDLSVVNFYDRREFNMPRDPRIDAILEGRNTRKDLAGLLNCKEDEISLTNDEALQTDRKIKYHYGDLKNIANIDGNHFPENVIGGDVKIGETWKSLKNVEVHDIQGKTVVKGLPNIEKIPLPGPFGGEYGSLTAENVSFVGEFEKKELFEGLTEARNVTLPKVLKGDLVFKNLVECSNTVFPENVKGDVEFRKLQNLDNVTLPKIEGNLHFRSLEKLSNVTFNKVDGWLQCDSLRSLTDATFAGEILKGMSFDCLEEMYNVSFEKNLAEHVNFSRVRDVENVTFNGDITGFIEIGTAKGDIRLNSLNFNGSVNNFAIGFVSSVENVVLPKHVHGNFLARKILLSDRKKNFVLPSVIDGDFSMYNENMKGFVMPTKVGGNVSLPYVTDIGGFAGFGIMDLPQVVGGSINVGTSVPGTQNLRKQLKEKYSEFGYNGKFGYDV